MQKKLIFFGIIACGLLFISAITVPTAEAAGTVSVIGSSVSLTSTEPVNIVQEGISISFTAGSNSPNTICWPIQSSINSDNVSLLGQGDNIGHPIYTLSYSKKSETYSDQASIFYYYKFRLSIPQPGYELSPNTEYELKLKGGSEGIRLACQNGSDPTIIEKYLPSSGYAVKFSTGEDTIAPVITEHSYLNTDSSAALGWITSEMARTQISYGTTPNFGLTKSVPGLYEKHFIELRDLLPGTKYYYRLESKDADGTQTVYKTGTFTTWAISPVVISDTTGHEASLMWTTTPATDSIIEYGTTATLGKLSGGHSLSTNHDVRLVHLQSNQTYYARIRLSNGDAESVSETFSFKTLDASAGVSADTITINPQFNSQFDFSNFNFKDFPEDVKPTPSASEGAVLAAQDDVLQSIAGNFGSIVEQHRWVLWLWVPVLILLFFIACIWMLHRHQHRANMVEQEILKQKAQQPAPKAPPSIS